MVAAAPGVEIGLELRARLADLYCAYDDALNDGALERWPELFTETCIYKVIPRENFDQGYPVALIYCESRDMLMDRVVALRETALFAPRIARRITSGICCTCDRTGRSAPDRKLRGVPDDDRPAQ